MSEPCPQCGQNLPPEAGGRCPRCLLGLALDPALAGAETASVAHEQALTAIEPPPEPPEPEVLDPARIGAEFPELSVQALLGRGGMGAVYRARQSRLDRDVALKVMLPRLAARADFNERFLREARALARLDHPGIVTVHDFGQRGELAYLLMEYVDGTNLRQAMREGRLAPVAALDVVRQLCEALQYAHDRGVVHRDIKPENVLISRAGRIKVADFGLAKLVEGPSAERGLTSHGVVMGTPSYMSPEQAQGSAQVDHRSDIYSLGVVFYELLTGELPLGRFAPPSEKAGTDVRVDPVVLKALAKEPERRYQQASHVASDLSEATSEQAPAAPATKPARPGRRRRVWLPALGGLALIVGGALWLRRPFQPHDLISAAASGDEARVRTLLDDAPGPDVRDAQRQTPLMFAAFHGHEGALRALLAAGADVNAKDDTGETALMKAAGRGHLACARALIAAGAEVNEVDQLGETAAFFAALFGHAPVLEALREAGADLRVRTRAGLSPLLVAARAGYTRCAEIALAAGANVDERAPPGWSALLAAAQNGHTTLLQLLISAHAHLEAADDEGFTPLLRACQSGQTKAAEALLEAGARADARAASGVTACSLAAARGDSALMSRLERAGCDLTLPDALGRNALYYAASGPQAARLGPDLVARGLEHPAWWLWQVMERSLADRWEEALQLGAPSAQALGRDREAWRLQVGDRECAIPRPALTARLALVEVLAARGERARAKEVGRAVLADWAVAERSCQLYSAVSRRGEREERESLEIDRQTLSRLTDLDERDDDGWAAAFVALRETSLDTPGVNQSSSRPVRGWWRR